MKKVEQTPRSLHLHFGRSRLSFSFPTTELLLLLMLLLLLLILLFSMLVLFPLFAKLSEKNFCCFFARKQIGSEIEKKEAIG